ncbi:MAG TPA: phage tail protein I [Clostridia bacterium]
MDLNDLDLLQLQSQHMQRDVNTQGFCGAITQVVKYICSVIKNCQILSRVDELPEEILDVLAYELHVDWYDNSLPIESKRTIIKNSDKVHMRAGTPDAVENVVAAWFGDGKVEEWFEYGGQPGMFRVITSNISITGDMAANFTRILNSVKRESAHLEEIRVTVADNLPMYFAGVVNIGEFLEIRQVE